MWVTFYNLQVAQKKGLFMKKNKIIGIIFLVLFTFTSFIILDPMKKGVPLEKSTYITNTKGMNTFGRFIPPHFYLREDNIFFIQPSLSIPAKANLKFKKDADLILKFSIPQKLSEGKLSFIIKKNGKEFKHFTLDRKNNRVLNIEIKVKKNDKLTVMAKTIGNDSDIIGNFKILKYMEDYNSKLFKLYLIPFLWTIIFIYLIYKGYIYIAFSSYLGFLLFLIADKITFGPLLLRDIYIYAAFFLLYTFLFVLIYQELQIIKRLKIATILKLISTILLLFIPASFIIFAFVFGKPINWGILFAIYQTNFDEAIGFIESFIPISYILILFFSILLLGYLFWIQEKKERKIISRFFLILVIILLGIFVSKKYFKPRIIYLIQKGYKDYNKQLEDFRTFQQKRKNSQIHFYATKKEKGEVYVVVIGESLNKNNMSLYGYFRNTTPKQLEQVKKDNLQVFQNVYSNAGNTMRSLSLALTEANQYNNKNFWNSLSFIDIFNKAKFDTYWISTHGDLGENIVSLIAHSSDHLLAITDGINVCSGATSYYDGISIDTLKRKISTTKNTLIIIHFYGSHFPYKDRYPKEFQKYKTTLPYMIGTEKEHILKYYTEYDNSVYYNDYVISNILNVIKNRGGVSAFMYFSDHAEAIARNRAHTSRLGSFTFAMAQIPLTAWFSPEYIKRYPKTYNTFISHKKKLFSNDMIYDTVLGLAHIKTDRYHANYDLSSSKYSITPKKAMILHARLQYTTPENHYYWQQYNTKLLNENGLIQKIVVTNTDTVGKLNDAWKLGFRSFELSIKYLKSQHNFQAGLKKFDMKGNLLDLFSYFQTNQIKNLFFNLTNLNQSNKNDILERLDYIDQKLNIKQKAILLIDQTDLIEYFQNKGWKVALENNNLSLNIKPNYYLLTKETYQKRKNVSTNNIIINHCLKLSNTHLNETLKKTPYLYNQQIKFLFVDFTSEYDK